MRGATLSYDVPLPRSNLGEDWDERVLPSIANEVLKATVAQYNAESLLTKREMVSRQVRETLRQRAGEAPAQSQFRLRLQMHSQRVLGSSATQRRCQAGTLSCGVREGPS